MVAVYKSKINVIGMISKMGQKTSTLIHVETHVLGKSGCSDILFSHFHQVLIQIDGPHGTLHSTISDGLSKNDCREPLVRTNFYHHGLGLQTRQERVVEQIPGSISGRDSSL